MSASPSALLLLAGIDAANCGVNFSSAQLVTWKGTETSEDAPSVPVIVAVIWAGLQSVGLNVNPCRSMVTFTFFSCTGIPSIMLGIAWPSLSELVVTVSAAVRGSTSILALTTTQSHGGCWAGLAVSCSRSKGPVLTGSTTDSPNGAP